MTKAQVIALIDQYITTNGNEEITGAQTNSVMKALANQDIPFSEIVSKPTTLSGYGITDAYTKSVSDGRYVNVTGDTMTGDLKLNNNSSISLGTATDTRIFSTGATTIIDLLDDNLLIRDNASDRFTFERTTGNFMSEGNITAKGNNAVNLVGIGTGDSNSVFISFNESNGTTRQALFGFPTTATGDLDIINDLASARIRIQASGTSNQLRFIDSGGNWAVWHSGNSRGDVQNDSRYALQTRTITAGTGLTGGGNLTANRTINFDTSWGDSRYALQSTQIITGNHLSGGGNLSTNRTLTLTPTVGSWIVDSQGNQRMYFNSNAAISNGILFKASAASQEIQYRNTSDNIVFRVDDSGNVTAQAFFESSDRRLKKNIEPLNYGLNEIEKIDTHTWNWKNNNESDIGVIAQELEAILPELVKTDEEGYKSVNYPKLIPILINAVKELNNKVNQLKNG